MSFIVFIGTLLYFGVKIEPADRTVTQSSALRCITYRRNGRAPNGNLRARPRAERLRISGFDKRPRSRSTHLRCVWGEHDNCRLCCHYCERVSGIVGNRSSDATHISSPLNPQTERLLSRCSFGPLQLISFSSDGGFLASRCREFTNLCVIFLIHFSYESPSKRRCVAQSHRPSWSHEFDWKALDRMTA